jgi:hypothetical protein
MYLYRVRRADCIGYHESCQKSGIPTDVNLFFPGYPCSWVSQLRVHLLSFSDDV